MSDIDPDFEELLRFLKETRGFDFTGYKRSSLMRRVNRRMQQQGIASYADYLDYLQLHQDEFTALFNTILINVTGFFRDPYAWLHLRDEVLPELLAAHKPNDPIRVWTAGCASGEEAYSIAIALAEAMGVDAFRERVKIYATDVDEEALTYARGATFTEREVRAVPPELVERYFEVTGQRYTFRKDLRRAVIFGRNDLVQDAPIGRVDILTCRNTLMYFNAETQARIVSRFHFALNDGGILFLGKADMLIAHGQLFAPVDLKRRIFRKVPRALPNGAGTLLPANGLERPLDPVIEAEQLTTQAMLESPVAMLVVTADGRLAAVNQAAEVLLPLSRRDVGRPFRDVDASYRPLELRPHIDKVLADGRAVWVRDVEWTRGGETALFLDIAVLPLRGADGEAVGSAVFFSDVTRYRSLRNELEYANRQLETAYEELQSTVEELETTNEELQSTVEELQSTNEELQSTNEELETMNEELQSTNDELQRINDVLRDRTGQLDEANTFLEAILRSLRAAVVVVDRDLLVRVWNRRAEDLWGLRSEEAVGEHLLSLDIGLSLDRLRPLLRSAFAGGGEPTELRTDAVNRRGRTIGVRVTAMPLQRPEGEASGVVLVMDEEERIDP